MRVKPSLAQGLTVLAVLAGLLAGYTIAPLLAPQPTLQPPAPNDNSIRVELMIYKNGELVYYDPDDPSTYNFLRTLIMFFMKNPPSVQQRDNTTVPVERINVNITDVGQAVIAISDGSGTFSRSMTDIPGTTKLFAYAGDSQVVFDPNTNTITISATFTINSYTTIRWVALLYDYYESDTNPGYGDEILLFADPTSISVATGDVLTVVYRIAAP